MKLITVLVYQEENGFRAVVENADPPVEITSSTLFSTLSQIGSAIDDRNRSAGFVGTVVSGPYRGDPEP